MMVMRRAVVIVGIVRQIAMVMIMVVMRFGALFRIGMAVFMQHSIRHSCEHAEGEELFDEGCHGSD